MTGHIFRRLFGKVLVLAVLAILAGQASPSAQAASSTTPKSVADCQKDSEFFKAYMQSKEAYTALRTLNYTTAVAETTKAAVDSKVNPWDSLRKVLCLDRFRALDTLIQTLLGKAGAILNMLLSLINQLLNVACQYVAAAISSVLNAICIPMPDLPGLPGFGGPSRKSCNGISLEDVLSIGYRPMRIPSVSMTYMNQAYEKARNEVYPPMVRDSRQRGAVR